MEGLVYSSACILSMLWVLFATWGSGREEAGFVIIGMLAGLLLTTFTELKFSGSI